jgi:hypothetical protein
VFNEERFADLPRTLSTNRLSRHPVLKYLATKLERKTFSEVHCTDHRLAVALLLAEMLRGR